MFHLAESVIALEEYGVKNTKWQSRGEAMERGMLLGVRVVGIRNVTPVIFRPSVSEQKDQIQHDQNRRVPEQNG